MVRFLPTSATATITITILEVGTTLTIIAPLTAFQGQSFRVSGTLRRADTNTILPGETITLRYNGINIGSDITAADGTYNIDAVIDVPGVFTLTSEFAGSERPGLALSPSIAKREIATALAATPIQTVIMVAAPIVVGLILTRTS